MNLSKSVMLFLTGAAALVVITGCGGGQDRPDVLAGDVAADDVVASDTAAGDAADDSWEGPEVVYWEPMPDLPLDLELYGRVPEVFARVSHYATTNEGANPKDPSFMGAVAAGNGLVFALFGYGRPTNSMHSFAGPGYDIADGFFGDYSLLLSPAGSGELSVFDIERVAHSLSAPVVITVGKVGAVELHTADFAPWFNGQGGQDQELLRHCVIRNVTVRNGGDAESADFNVVVKAFNRDVTSPSDGVMVENREARMLVTRVSGASATVDGTRMTIPVGVLAAGAEKSFVVSHCAHATGDIPAMPEINVLQLVKGTAAQWNLWEENLVDVVTPDPMVNDFIDGMKMTLKLQTADSGATCPMSEYTRTWARDNMGPVVGMLSLGGFEDVEGYLDYVYHAILVEGDLKNSYSAVYDQDWGLLSVPDWSAMPPLGDGAIGKKRVSAETPSYMVLMYGLHNRFTGKTDRIVERRGLLHRCLFAQGFGPGDMLPFTGDETYRAAMNAAMGLEDLDFPHEEWNWSGNSSALWLGAAREYRRFMAVADAANESDLSGEVAQAAARFDEVEQATQTAFTGDDGCFAAYVAMADGTRSAPFEDASLQVTWSGWKDGDDGYAQKAFECLYGYAKTVDGEICSELDERHMWVFRNATEGVYTGMLPGYTLHSMTVLGHPHASDAFNMVRESLSSTGDIQEYMILDDHSGLTIMYNADGIVEPSDYTAKYRPWEGGIVLDAVMQYLFGFEPDANTHAMELRPHLPNNWPTMSANRLRAGDDRFDLTVTATKTGHQVKIVPVKINSEPWTVSLRWDLVGGRQLVRAVNNGVEVDSGAIVQIPGAFGQSSVVLPDFQLSKDTPSVTIAFEESLPQ